MSENFVYKPSNSSNNKDTERCKPPKPNLCDRFADILDSVQLPSPEGVCVVTRKRNIAATIKGRPTISPLSINALFSFEDLDRSGNALNLGETVILQEEINPFITALRAFGLEVTALHNHWLFDDPRLFYIHWLSVENPLDFAKKTAAAFNFLENNC